jgi:hypothetical protein
MTENNNRQEINHDIPEATFHTPISALDIPNHIGSLLEKNEYHNVGELALQLVTDKQKILAINGIGPKILGQIEVAANNFEPEDVIAELPYHPPPVPLLADFYKPPYKHTQQKTLKYMTETQETEKNMTYNSPVPSLADFFEPENMVVILESSPSDELKAEKKKSKPVPKHKSKNKKKNSISKKDENKQSKKDKKKTKIQKPQKKKNSKKKRKKGKKK